MLAYIIFDLRCQPMFYIHFLHRRPTYRPRIRAYYQGVPSSGIYLCRLGRSGARRARFYRGSGRHGMKYLQPYQPNGSYAPRLFLSCSAQGSEIRS